MAASYKFPGVYASIKDLSGVVANNAVTACAYVGEAEYGPILEPTLLTSLQDYTDRFGTLSSKYGYAGYSLAVAAETISQHYFVRVVPVGDANESEEDRKNNAKWAACTVMAQGSTAEAPVSTGYFYEEVTAAKNSRDAGNASGLFQSDDMNSAFIVMANDPNNRKFYVSIADSTINENRAYAVLADTVCVKDTAAGTTKVTVTVPYAVVADLETGSKIVVSRMSEASVNGVFVVDSWTESSQVDIEGNPVNGTITFTVQGLIDSVEDENARVGRYPDADETTFSVTISEKIGRVMTVLESYDYCTLYQAQDSYGNSTYIEDVINNTSNYVQVFVNKNQEDADPETIVIPQNVTNVALTGGKAGTWTDAGAKYSALCAAWELFRDRSQTTVSLLMNSGYVLKGNTSYQNKMLEIAEARRDCFCLFDIPMTETDYDNAVDWRKNIQGINSYRCAISSPWVKTYDAVQGRSNFVMCPSAYVAKICGSSDPWIAPAGLNRGVLTASTVSPTGLTQYYDETIGGNLYTDNQINCIIKSPSAGYVNWGQRTMQQKPSALDRINVARTVIYIETVLRDAAQWHLFENNTEYERLQITLQFSAFLDTILSASGISGYKCVCDSSNNTPQVIANNQLKVDIYLYPVYTAEVILLSTTVMGADASVTVTSG